LKGLEISEVFLSELEFSGRLDSEYYKPSFIEYEKIIKSKENLDLKKLSNFLIGPFGSAFTVDNYVTEKDYRYIRGKDVKPLKIRDNDNVYMPKSDYDRLSKYALKENDILVSVVGTTGNAALITKKDLPAIFSCKSTVLRPYDINSVYLLTYINTKYGRDLLLRKERGAIQKGLNLGDLESLGVYIPSKGFQIKIEEIFRTSLNQTEQSKQTYTQAENILLEEIGLQNFTPSKEPVNIKSFKDSFATSGRLDAEYYQPRYEKIEQAIKSYSNGFETLDAFIDDYSTGYPYKSSSYIKENGIPLIRINNVKKGFLDLSKAIQIPTSDLDLSSKDIALENDILISMSGTIGNSCKIPKGIKAVVNQRIMKITPKNFNNEVLSLLINSVMGEYQLNRIGTGGVQTNISSTDIRKIFIPKIIEKKQQQIADLIAQSFSLKKQSEHLLKVAKRTVEIAIEESEAIALKYINQETK
jgi:restriction endonuclease S subunit